MSRRTTKDEKLRILLQALQLRMAGADFEEIAATINPTLPVGVVKITPRALQKLVVDRLAASTNESMAEYRVLELERLDRLYLPAYQKAVSKTSADMKALDACLKISKLRMTLMGLTTAQASMMNDQKVNAQNKMVAGSETPGELYQGFTPSSSFAVADEILEAEYDDIPQAAPFEEEAAE